MGYKVKPPKCGCEFWRRERRVKKPYSEEIVGLKYEMACIRKSIDTISRINEAGREHRIELGLLMAGARSNIKEIAKVTTVSDTQKRNVRIREKQFFNNETDQFWTSMAIHYLRELHQQKHLRCLQIRREQREKSQFT